MPTFVRVFALSCLLIGCGGRGDYNPIDDSSDQDDVGDVGPSDDDEIDFEWICVGSCGECDPLTHAACGADKRCTWIWDSLNDPSTEMVEPTVGHLGCAFAGTIPEAGRCARSGPTTTPAEAESCTETADCGPGLTCIDSLCRNEGTGAAAPDQCERGTYCLAGTCKAICNLEGGEPSCGENASCSLYSGIFLSMGTAVAGVCEPRCDPLTQRTQESELEACNSRVASNPDTGCFANNGEAGLEFTCARVPPEAKGRTQDAPAYGPDAGGAYRNGCEAGYLPFWSDATDETVTVCSGTCAPLDADASMPAAAVGDASKLAKLPSLPTSRVGDGVCTSSAKGAEVAADCRYLWPSVVDDMGNPASSPFGDIVGTCYSYGDRVYDHDHDPATAPIPEPSCADLPPAGGDPASTPHGITADQLGCYSSTRTAGMPSARPRTRIGVRSPDRVVLKHVLR